MPQPWRNKAVAFKDEDAARAFLGKIRVTPSTIQMLSAAAGPAPAAQQPAPTGGLPPAPAQSAPVQLAPTQPAPPMRAPTPRPHAARPSRPDVDELVKRVAPTLIAGQAWIIPVEREPNPRVGTTDPAVLSRVNSKFGTNIDFNFLGTHEGGQWTRGYVPIDKDGIAVQSSGMTIATGFDIGQWTVASLTGQLRLEQSLAEKLMFFTKRDGQRYMSMPPGRQIVGQPAAPLAVEPTGNFYGLTKAGIAQVVAATAPVPVITKDEADKLDAATLAVFVSALTRAWDNRPQVGAPKFVNLPSGWQTAMLSRSFNQGPILFKQPFFEQARAGDWLNAIETFGSYHGNGSNRVEAEMRLMRAEIPSAPGQPQRSPNPSRAAPR